ncbi:hypothetical protein D3C79_572320 [compost metagenome]
MFVDDLVQATHTKRTFDRFGLAVALAQQHAGPVQLDTEHGDHAERVIRLDLEAVAIRHPAGHPFVGSRPGVIDGDLTRDAVLAAYVHQGQADAVGVLADVGAPADDLAAVDVLPEPGLGADHVAVEPAHEDVVQVAIAVDPLHGVQPFDGAFLRWVELHQRMLTFTQHHLLSVGNFQIHAAHQAVDAGHDPGLIAGGQLQPFVAAGGVRPFAAQVVGLEELPGTLADVGQAGGAGFAGSLLLLGHQHGQPVAVVEAFHRSAVAAQGRQGDLELVGDVLVGLHQRAAGGNQGMHRLDGSRTGHSLGVTLVVGLLPVGPQLLFAVARRLWLGQIQRHATDHDLASLAQQGGLDDRWQDAEVVFGGLTPFALTGFVR